MNKFVGLLFVIVLIAGSIGSVIAGDEPSPCCAALCKAFDRTAAGSEAYFALMANLKNHNCEHCQEVDAMSCDGLEQARAAIGDDSPAYEVIQQLWHDNYCGDPLLPLEEPEEK